MQPRTASTTYVFVAMSAGQVESGVAIIVLHISIGLVVQQQQLAKGRRKQVIRGWSLVSIFNLIYPFYK